ncbi:putative TIR domain-containing protein [Helianthus annuus]|nr:putative TIR domain-containing protein [Helianthus annuus]
MASSSSYSHPAPALSSSQSCNFDVFLSFRGEDTRKTFVDHLYSALVDRKISTYKDDETLSRGESIRPSLFEAIKGSQIAVVVFSENYADSSWCLEELAYIMKCKDKRGLTVMPIFYDVLPSEVRKQKRKFGEAFAKHEMENMGKVESWRKALVGASEIAGWEPKNIANGHEIESYQRNC